MKTTFLFLTLLSVSLFAGAQDKYMTKTGHVRFYGHTPMEDILANNQQAASILDVKTGDIVINILIKSFEFERALMQEHFNENYMESDKYPKATFKGNVTNMNKVNPGKDGSYPVTVMGDLTIHNVTKNTTTPGTLEVKGGRILANAKFMVAPEDFGIQIPGVVKEKIAKEMDVTVELAYDPMK
jgi:polyisoprenoid-binding protein YceI